LISQRNRRIRVGTQAPSRRVYKYLVLGGVGLLALPGGYAVSLVGESYPLAIVGLVASSLLTATSFVSPRFALYTLLISAILNRFEIPFGEINLRPDQVVLIPVVAGVALRAGLVTMGMRRSGVRPRRQAVSVAVFSGFALYILINALSSFLFSPQPTESYQIVIWFTLSFLAFTTAYFVIGRYVSVREAFYLVLALGFISAAVGIVFSVLFALTGSTLGIQQDPNFKLAGTFFEANIFGSFQAFAAIGGLAVLQLGEVRGKVYGWVATGTVLSIFALALSFTRAAWLGFLLGLIVLAFFQLRGGRFMFLLARVGWLVGIVLLILALAGLFEDLSARFASIDDLSTGTAAYRVERYETALEEWRSAPVLGLGTNSYGQRHLDPSQNYGPDYLPGLFIATLYDVGIVGLIFLLAIFAVIVGALIRVVRSRNAEQRFIALALLCGVTALLVSYQATNAFWFSYSWIIFAIAFRLYESVRLHRVALGSDRPASPRSQGHSYSTVRSNGR
jgi:O-antigen ligase